MEITGLALVIAFCIALSTLTFVAHLSTARQCQRIEDGLRVQETAAPRSRPELVQTLVFDPHLRRATMTLRTRLVVGDGNLADPPVQELAAMVCSRWSLIGQLITEAPESYDSLLDSIAPTIVESYELLRSFMEQQRESDPGFGISFAVLHRLARDRTPLPADPASPSRSAVLEFGSRSA